MEELLLSFGLPALFLTSFLAATVLPLGSEWLLILLILNRYDPLSVIISATAGNYLGACTTYFLGIWGSDFLQKRILRFNSSQIEKAEKIYTKFGQWSLLLSWVPVIGDPLCFLAGAFHIRFLPFSILVFLGKCGRYSFLVYIILQTM